MTTQASPGGGLQNRQTEKLAVNAGSTVEKEISSREVSKVSVMPPGLINVLTKDEILDLLAYLASGGDEKAAAFAK